MLILVRRLWQLLAVTWLLSGASASSDYHESLHLRPLPQAGLLASFSFRSNASSSSFEQQNFRFFPRSLGQILHHTHTKELHLRFSTGRWDEETWGARPRGGAREGGTGVELWAWVEADSDAEADRRWLTVTNALSGLFCASLNFIDSTRTIRPVMAFEPEGQHSPEQLGRLHLLHGTLPREVVCTENLTPFLKLIPCKGKAGVSSLLDGHKVFDSSWQSMAIDVRPICPEGDGAECQLEIQQSIDMVLDIDRSKRPRDDPIPRPAPIETFQCNETKAYHQFGDACYPIPPPAYPAFTIEEIFGRAIKGTCPLVDEQGQAAETLCIDVPADRGVQVNTTGKYTERREGFSTCYSMPVGTTFDLAVAERAAPIPQHELPFDSPLLLAERTFSGHGQEKGGVNVVIENPAFTSIDFVYLESLPWFMKPYLHTLQARVKLMDGTSFLLPERELLRHMYYRPAVDRARGTHLELILSLPPKATITLTYDFEKAILRYTEYPPDANRGFDAAPAIIRVLDPPQLEQGDPGTGLDTPLPPVVYIRTTSLLLYLPTPDFSMPYNVIILTSTVIALGFGTIFNLLARRFVAADEVGADSGGLLSSAKRRWAGRIAMIRDRLSGKGKGTKEL